MDAKSYWLHWFDFSPLCIFKCLLRSPAWMNAKSHWLHLCNFCLFVFVVGIFILALLLLELSCSRFRSIFWSILTSVVSCLNSFSNWVKKEKLKVCQTLGARYFWPSNKRIETLQQTLCKISNQTTTYFQQWFHPWISKSKGNISRWYCSCGRISNRHIPLKPQLRACFAASQHQNWTLACSFHLYTCTSLSISESASVSLLLQLFETIVGLLGCPLSSNWTLVCSFNLSTSFSSSGCLWQRQRKRQKDKDKYKLEGMLFQS